MDTAPSTTTQSGSDGDSQEKQEAKTETKYDYFTVAPVLFY